MTFEEAKNILINRGFVEVNGFLVFDGDKWRDAITVISKWLEQEPCDNNWRFYYNHGYAQAKRDLKEKTGWIYVNEKKPESEGYGHYFLCCLENGLIRILGYSNILTTRCPKGFYYEKENGTTWRQDMNPVIAWMPLPEPYEPQESEDEE